MQTIAVLETLHIWHKKIAWSQRGETTLRARGRNIDHTESLFYMENSEIPPRPDPKMCLALSLS